MYNFLTQGTNSTTKSRKKQSIKARRGKLSSLRQRLNDATETKLAKHSDYANVKKKAYATRLRSKLGKHTLMHFIILKIKQK